MALTCKEKGYEHTPTVKWHFLLVTAAVWREPQLTAIISHDGETSSRAGNAWIDMNTSPCFSPSCGSSAVDGLAFWHCAPVKHSTVHTIYHYLSYSFDNLYNMWLYEMVFIYVMRNKRNIVDCTALYWFVYVEKKQNKHTCLWATLLLLWFSETSRRKSKLATFIPSPHIKVTPI